jgi:hypothetical protein
VAFFHRVGGRMLVEELLEIAIAQAINGKLPTIYRLE